MIDSMDEGLQISTSKAAQMGRYIPLRAVCFKHVQS